MLHGTSNICIAKRRILSSIVRFQRNRVNEGIRRVASTPEVFWKELACAVPTTLTAGRGASRPTWIRRSADGCPVS